MRDIKFRGIKKDGTFSYGNLLSESAIGKWGNSEHYSYAEVDENTVGQFTGLKDKNGVEVYEGDILKINDDWDSYGMNAGEIYEIYFAFGGFRCKPKYNPNAKGTYVEDGEDFEIIGNIYENPELLC